MGREPLGPPRAVVRAVKAAHGTFSRLRPFLHRRARRGPQPPPAPARRPLPRALGTAATALLGAWLGLLVAGSVQTPVGPVDTRMSLRPSLTGGTTVDVPPLGALELDSHTAPLRLEVDVDRIDPERARALVDHPERLTGLEDRITEDIRSGTADLLLRASAAALAGAAVLGLAVHRRPRRALAAGGLTLALLASSGLAAYATWNPKSVLEPKFSGLLAGAPSVVGSARSIFSEFDVYQQELARLVTNVTKLYDAVSDLPAYRPDPNTVRVLHVSDIHLNPAAWHIIRSLVEQYEVDVIVDAGDTMDHGTAAENGFLDSIEDLGAPYVWVRGNHDSRTTQKYIGKLDNVHVLDDGKPVTVAGLRMAGIGDPQFTPDRSVVPGGDPAERKAGRELARALRESAAADRPVHIAVAHNPVAAQQTDGAVPLVLAGHLHRRETLVMDRGTRLMVEGSTGGGGLRAVEDDEPQDVMASVLYLDEKTKELQAWDAITLGGLGLTTAEVSRHLPEEAEPEPPRAPSPSPTGSPSPAGAVPPPRSPSPAPPPTPGR